MSGGGSFNLVHKLTNLIINLIIALHRSNSMTTARNYSVAIFGGPQ